MTSHLRCVRACSVAILATLMFVSGCRREAKLRPDDPAVFAYGYGPQPNRHVKYQPGVVMLAGGPKAIRAVSDDSLTWTIDGKAEGASDLKVGKVMFASSRAVGRITELQRRGNDLA